MSLTTAQQQAITARGNVLVVAGAGTGKTHTLVERCLICLLDEKPPASLDEILMVTFTDAAAAEMRQRIRARLEEELKHHGDDRRWREQLALFDTAHIGTLHSFCLELVRQHFYELELDPQLMVLPGEEAALLAGETLDAVLERHYAGRTAAGEAVQQLIEAQGRGSDQPIRELVLRLHHYTQTLPDPAGWLAGQVAMFESAEPVVWRQWLLEAADDWREWWLPILRGQADGNEIAARCLEALSGLRPPGAMESGAARAHITGALERIVSARDDCPRGKKTEWLKPIKEFLSDADFLLSLARVHEPAAAGPADPLVEDWGWVRPQMATLLHLTGEFSKAFADAKRELGAVDFHDLEQFALRLLWDARADGPTDVARQWRQRFRFVFVDEYQDINAAQDRILQAVSRDGAQSNRFLVGDVKQSIYRFRLADPRIFQGYVETWHGERGRAIPLADNFRSREGILSFVNSLFGLLMRREVGGVQYDEEARLRFAAAKERAALSVAANPSPRVELQLRIKGGSATAEAEPDEAEALAEVMELEEADKEARLVALRLGELKAQKHPVWDEPAGQFRPVAWSDMAVLLRAPANKAESYAKEFSRLKVPLLVERGGFYESVEVTDLLSLLQMLDNPLQDLPVLAVLRSPLVGLTLNELAAIRLTARTGRFWTALVTWEENQRRLTPAARGAAGEDGAGLPKVSAFLERFGRWRQLARQGSLSRTLEAILSETHYAEWVLTQPRGEQRYANVRRLVDLAQQFDQFQRQGLFRFLRFVEAQQAAEAEPEVAAVSDEDAVRLMSIHQSKGLEFPVVVAADLGKPFNLSDLRGEVLLDRAYGLCPQIKPPHTGRRYPSLPHWLACRREKRELLGEELRLLYVAMTRARDTLILSGAVSKTSMERLWNEPRAVDATALLGARSYADWLGLWFALNAGGLKSGVSTGENALLRWAIHDDAKLIGAQPEAAADSTEGVIAPEPAVLLGLRERLLWRYGFTAATYQPAKTSVSVLRRRAAETDEEAAAIPARSGPRPEHPRGLQAEGKGRGRSGVEVGTAHHTFLEFVSLERVGSVEELRQEAERLRLEGVLAEDGIAQLDFEGMAAFWQSEPGRKVQAQARFVQRELAFTARFSAAELATVTGEAPQAGLEGEFVVVQGVADLTVVRKEEIWLIDFKTDQVAAQGLADKVRLYEPQLRLYALALARIYRRPVSACWLYFLALQRAVAVGSSCDGGSAANEAAS